MPTGPQRLGVLRPSSRHLERAGAVRENLIGAGLTAVEAVVRAVSRPLDAAFHDVIDLGELAVAVEPGHRHAVDRDRRRQKLVRRIDDAPSVWPSIVKA